MKRRAEKRAQTELSFGMIFSIILIIVFLMFAFYGIKLFLDLQKTASSGKFLKDLQADVDRVWKSTQSSEKKEYFLTKAVSRACFADFGAPARGTNAGFYDDLKRANFGSENFVFYPFGSTEPTSVEMKNVDLASITETENPYCISNVNGKIQATLVKDVSDSLVKVRR